MSITYARYTFITWENFRYVCHVYVHDVGDFPRIEVVCSGFTVKEKDVDVY